MSEKDIPQRSDYFEFMPIVTRWMDNDIYGHVNNVTYYSYFDSAANRYLIEEAGLDIHNGDVIGFVVNSGCSYLSPIAYPDDIEVGLRIDKLGNSSVHYGLAIFKKGQEQACAHGFFVHVFVNRETQKPVALPTKMRDAFERILKK